MSPHVTGVPDFMPDEDDCLDGEAARAYAEGQLCALLQQLVWQSVMDSGPRSIDTMAFVHDLSRPEWRKNPLLAIAALKAVRDDWSRRFDAQRGRGITDGTLKEILEPSGATIDPITNRSMEALALFSCYTEALVRLKIMSRAEVGYDLMADEVMAGVQP